MEKVLKCVNLALSLSSYLIFLLRIPLSAEVNCSSLIRDIWCFEGTLTLTMVHLELNIVDCMTI